VALWAGKTFSLGREKILSGSCRDTIGANVMIRWIILPKSGKKWVSIQISSKIKRILNQIYNNYVYLCSTIQTMLL
jgi:hypothetical protein